MTSDIFVAKRAAATTGVFTFQRSDLVLLMQLLPDHVSNYAAYCTDIDEGLKGDPRAVRVIDMMHELPSMAGDQAFIVSSRTACRLWCIGEIQRLNMVVKQPRRQLRKTALRKIQARLTHGRQRIYRRANKRFSSKES